MMICISGLKISNKYIFFQFRGYYQDKNVIITILLLKKIRSPYCVATNQQINENCVPLLVNLKYFESPVYKQPFRMQCMLFAHAQFKK